MYEPVFRGAAEAKESVANARAREEEYMTRPEGDGQNLDRNTFHLEKILVFYFISEDGKHVLRFPFCDDMGDDR